MEFDDDDEFGKTFTTLTNYYNEPMNDSKLHFEKFLFAGDSDSEVEHEENFTYSDDSNGFEEEVEDIEDPLNVLSDVSQHFSQGSEDWRNSDSQCLTLTELMRMNRNEKFQLLQLFHKIKDFLIDIQNRMKILKTSSQKIRTKESIMFLGHVGAPYFKTKKDMFCSDPNPDTLDRRKRGLLTIYQHGFPSRWSKTECDNLTRGVKLTYNLNKQRAILKDIGYLRRKIAEETDSAIILQKEYEIEKMEGEIRNLKAIGIEDVPPLCEDKFIDWEHISTEYLMEKHTAKECSIFWRIYLHPDLNKSNWSTRENKVIRELAEKYNYQDWDRIAQELGTNRSAFTIFIHYSSTLCHQPIKMRFSEEEDRALLQHIESKKTGAIIPWNTIAEFFPNRSKIQLIHRYKYYLRNMSQYTTEFSDAEDILILLLVERFGRNYVQFPKYLPSKSYMQIKARYDNHLRFNRVKGSFTLEEDRQIMDHFSNKKFEITHLSAHMNRNRLQLRQRYKKLTEFFNKHPDKSLEDVRRRFGKKNETFRKLEFLKYVVDQFKDQVDIPSLSDIESKLGKKKSKKNQNFDNLLVTFFSSSYTIKRKSFETSLSKIQKTAEQIHSITKILGINLRIPAEIKKNNTLDIVDIEILNLLREKEYTHMPRPSINEFLPPNINSLIGLRGLLLKNQSYKRMKNKETVIYRGPALMNLQKHNLTSELDDFLKSKDSNTQSMILFERNLFLKRFISMFMWPALLSIESPSSCLLEKEFGLNNSNHSKETNKKNNTSENKLLKRKLDGNIDIPLPKKTSRTSPNDSDESKCNHESMQPIRSSSRLRDKKRISEKISLQAKITEEDIETSKLSGQQSNSCKEVEESINVRSNANSKDKLCESNKNKQVILSNLVRVDKNEVMKLLQNKKPIKIIKIQCIKEQDGSLPTRSQPSHSKTDNESKNIQNLKNVEASSSITSADNTKNNNNTNSLTISQNSNSPGNRLLNLYEMKNTLNNSFKNGIRGKPTSKISNNDDAEDILKLDDLLNNVEDEDSIIDLTETEVMKNEVEQLDQLIKQEKSLSLF